MGDVKANLLLLPLDMSMRKKQLPNLFVPSASYDLINGPFTSLVESDNKGSHCTYHKGDGKTKSTWVRNFRPILALLDERKGFPNKRDVHCANSMH